MKRDKLKNKGHFLEISLGVFASTFACFWASLLVITTFLFVIKQPLSILNIILALILTLVFSIWYTKVSTNNIQEFFLVIFESYLLLVITFIPLLIMSLSIYDLSFDGQAYHQEAIIQLSRGWNPVYMILTNEATGNLERWLNHYPKGAWIFAASLYKLTGNIEAGKVLAPFSAVVSFFFVLWSLWGIKKIPMWGKVLVSASLAFNPVSIYQSLSFYIDGVLVSWLLSLLAICTKLFQSKQKHLFWPFIFVFIILANIKLTSIVFAGVLVSAFIFYLWLSNKLRLALWVFKATLLASIVGVIFVGFNPFVTNLALKGHPLYPAMGPGAYDYTHSNTPQNYWELPSPARLILSIFSVSSQARGEGKYSTLKLPFVVKSGEMDTFRDTNPKVGGFGPLFSGALVLSLLLLVISLFLVESKMQKITLLGAMGSILASAAIVSTSSVARYVPYVWWVPSLIVLLALSSGKLVGKIGGMAVLIVLFINIVGVAYTYFSYNIEQSNKLTHELLDLSRRREALAVDVGLFGSTKIKLRDFEIPYREVYANSECSSRKRFLVGNVAVLCATPSATLSP